MDSFIESKLLSYQKEHVLNLCNRLSNNYICFDCSDTGTGKTYAAIAVAKQLKMSVFVVCPKTIMSSWLDIINLFKIECIGISNYELLITTKCYIKGEKKISPYITKTNEHYLYKWTLPDNTLIIFDEVHRCCNPSTQTSNLLLSLKNIYDQKHPLLLLSATIYDTPSKFALFAVLLKWAYNINLTFDWLKPTYNPVRANQIIKDRISIKNMCKISISDLGDQFKKNQVLSEYFDIKKTIGDEIDSLHQEIIVCIDAISNKRTKSELGTNTPIRNYADSSHSNTHHFAKMNKARQRIELLKVPIFVDLVEQYLDNNFSIVIFVSYTNTLNLLAKTLKTNCIVYGEQTIEHRLKNIKKFVNDKERIIICNIQCGGDSISLNDKNGKYPRISLISPPYSGIKLIQACGRISRSDSQTASFNKIIFANTPIEIKLCNRLKNKCSVHDTITDADLTYDKD